MSLSITYVALLGKSSKHAQNYRNHTRICHEFVFKRISFLYGIEFIFLAAFYIIILCVPSIKPTWILVKIEPNIIGYDDDDGCDDDDDDDDDDGNNYI